MKSSKKAPYFTTMADIEISPSELEDAGWVYGGAPPPRATAVADVIRRWHDDEHDAPWRFCSERPCLEIRGLHAAIGSDALL